MDPRLNRITEQIIGAAIEGAPVPGAGVARIGL